MKYNIFALSLLLMSKSLFSGVYVISDMPAGFSVAYNHAEELVKRGINRYSQIEETNFELSPTEYNPHFSWAFVNPDTEGSIEDVVKKYPALVPAFTKIAKDTKKIQMRTSSTISFWKGTVLNGVRCGQKIKKNYTTAILDTKTQESSGVDKLADDITEALQTEYGISQRNKFSLHVSLGRISEENDQSVEGVTEFLESGEQQPIQAWGTIFSFKLVAPDGSFKEFKLAEY